MPWPSRGKPELIQTRHGFKVRYYDPIAKQCRVYKTRSERGAKAFADLWR